MFLVSNEDPVVEKIRKYLTTTFGSDNEFGLLNRLDNDTTGLLYFAKSLDIKKQRKELQNKWKIVKYYLADVRWNIDRSDKCVAYPIAHHPQAKDRMICLQDSTSTHIQWQPCETWIEKLYYDEEKNYSCLLVMIRKWVRHQIRCHLAAIGCPIIGEKIYKKKKDTEQLHLWSIGVCIEKNFSQKIFQT
jgi:23S rRNA-/tRNA-specific pseudouridylate synthase